MTLHGSTAKEPGGANGPGAPQDGAPSGRVIVHFHPRSILTAVGPLVATIVVTAVALTVGLTSALVSFGLLLVYHVIEGHTLRPMLYGRTVKLSPLNVLIAILLGTEIAGILGALMAIPVAGSIQVLIRELLQRRDEGQRSIMLG